MSVLDPMGLGLFRPGEVGSGGRQDPAYADPRVIDSQPHTPDVGGGLPIGALVELLIGAIAGGGSGGGSAPGAGPGTPTGPGTPSAPGVPGSPGGAASGDGAGGGSSSSGRSFFSSAGSGLPAGLSPFGVVLLVGAGIFLVSRVR